MQVWDIFPIPLKYYIDLAMPLMKPVVYRTTIGGMVARFSQSLNNSNVHLACNVRQSLTYICHDLIML